MYELCVNRPETPSETLIQVSGALFELSGLLRGYEQSEPLVHRQFAGLYCQYCGIGGLGGGN